MAAHGDETADVVVVGGGPAGSVAALQLARAGFHVIQLERRAFDDPRGDGLRSGEGLIPRTQRELATLHVPLNEADWQLAPVNRVAFHWPNGARGIASLPASSHIVHVHRGRFDGALFAAARQAGVDGREGWRVRDFVLEQGGVAGVAVLAPKETTPRTIRARLVIDAGGRNALALRQFDLRTPLPGADFFAMAMFFDDVAGLPDGTWEMHMVDPERLTVVQLSRMEPGLVRCGLGVTQQVQQAEACDPQTLFWRRIGVVPELLKRFEQSHMVARPFVRASLGYGVRRVALDGLLLAGDAGGYLNPLFGDGILRALRDGRAAANAAAALLCAPNARWAFNRYARRHNARRAYDRVLAGALGLGYHAPGVLSALGQVNHAPAALVAALTR